jgi:hypothetical protein
MFLLYLDDSGSVKNASDTQVVLAGLCCFERVPYFLTKQLDNLATEIWPDSPQGLEFRGSDMFGGRKHWRGVDKSKRIEAYKSALTLLAQNRDVTLFGAVINKAALSPEDPMEYGFEQLVNRFDRFLSRMHKQGNSQRGLVVLDKSTYETSIQALARDFQDSGHRWGRLKGMADVPLFVDSRATRMVQYADMVAYALRRYYVYEEDEFFKIISNKFDREGGITHGLVHFTQQNTSCLCPACQQKKSL